jgi:O-antigen/teichoic acid export membrane protein
MTNQDVAPQKTDDSSQSNDDNANDRRVASKRNYIWIGLTQVVIAASALLTYRFARRWFGQDGFSEYAFARRILTSLVPIIGMGLGLAVSRQVALTHDKRERHLLGAMVVTIIVSSLFLGLGFLIPDTLGLIFFGVSSHGHLIPPVILMTVGSAMHLITYGYFRGTMQFHYANRVEIINVAVFPIAGFVLGSKDAASALWWTGSLLCVFCLLIQAFILRGAILQIINGGWWLECKSLVNYGARRIPGELAWASIFSLPSTFAGHWVGLREAGLMAFGNTLLTLASTAVAPVNVVLLPQAVKMLQEGNQRELKSIVNQLLIRCVGLSLIGLLLGQLFLDWGMVIYFGTRDENAIHIARLIMLGAPACVVYVCLRSLIDAAHHRAVNSANLIIALAVIVVLTVALHVLMPGMTSIICAFLAGLHVLALLTWRSARNIFLNPRHTL